MSHPISGSSQVNSGLGDLSMPKLQRQYGRDKYLLVQEKLQEKGQQAGVLDADALYSKVDEEFGPPTKKNSEK